MEQKAILRSMIILTSLIGILGIYNFFIGSYSNPDLMFSIGGTFSFVENVRAQFQETDYFDELAKTLVNECETEECKAMKIFNYLAEFEYKIGSQTNPAVVLDRKSFL